MRLICGSFREDARAYGWTYSKAPGYRHVLIVEFYRWQWALEFGRGDGYDW